MPQLPDFQLETYFSKWEFTAKYHLCASDAQTMAMRDLLALAEPDDLALWQQAHLGYTETWGLPLLRQTIATTYESLDAKHVLCFSGAEEGIFCAMHALLDAHDHAIVFTPNYQSLETIPRSICRVTALPLCEEQNWSIDLDEVRQAICKETKLIVINFPHNPTGKVLEHEIFDQLLDLAREHGLYLFSDEVYRLLERDAARTLPQAAQTYEKALSLGVLSKSYGLPGLRLGWIACQDEHLLSRMERTKHYLSICNSGPSEILAVIALKARDTILERNRALVRENLSQLSAFFNEFKELFEWCVPDGGCVGFPRYKGPEGAYAFTRSLVLQSGVLLLPGSVYAPWGKMNFADRFRIGYGRANMKEALDAFRTYLLNI